MMDLSPELHQEGATTCNGDSRPTLGRAYDAEGIREGLRARRISHLLAKRNTEHGSGLGRWRCVAERTLAWFSQFRRLRVRYEKRAEGGYS
jgi:hypothetical protein